MKSPKEEKLHFLSGLTPQRRFTLQEFSRALDCRKLHTSELMVALVHLREMNAHPVFFEWGSAVAHIRRNQGWVWEAGLSIWATHTFYANLDEEKVPIDPLPLDIFNSIKNFLEDVSDFQLAQDFAGLFSRGNEKKEIFAILDHLYYVPDAKLRKEPREKSAFAILSSSKGITKEDKLLLERLILYVKEMALEMHPVPLDELVLALEETMCRLKIRSHSFTKGDRAYLELHLLVAFHNTLLDFCPKAFRSLTGHELGAIQPMMFVSSMNSFLTLDIGFFELEESKYLEPRELATGRRFGKFYYPLLASTLDEEDYLLEADEDIRVCLYNHPLFVRKYQGKWVIMAGNRKASRFPPKRSRYQWTRRRNVWIPDRTI